MSESKHTRGPWSFKEGRKSHREMSTIIQKGRPGNEDFQIALVTCEWVNEKQRSEDVANARLIAAAPDLLAAVQSLMSTFVSSDHVDWPDVVQARAAIAKATGAAC